VVLQESAGVHAPFVGLMRAPDPVRSMTVYTPTDGGPSTIITGSDAGNILMWEVKTCKLVRRIEAAHAHRIRGLAVYTPDTTSRANVVASPKKTNTGPALAEKVLLVSGSDDKTAAVWDFASGTLIARLTGGHRWFITSVTIFMPTYGTAPFVVTSGWDNYSLIWNVGTGKPMMKLSPKSGGGAVSSVVDFVSPQLQIHLGTAPSEVTRGVYLLTTGFDKTITIWDGESGQMLKQYATPHTDVISCAAVFAPPAAENGLYCITGSFDHTAIVWDLLTGTVMRTLEGHTDWVMSVSMFRINSGKPFFAMALTGAHDGTAIMWDLVHGIAVRKFEGVHALPLTGTRFLARFPDQGGGGRSAYDNNVEVSAYYVPNSGQDATGEAHSRKSKKTNGNGGNGANGGAAEREAHPFPYVLTCCEDHTIAFWDLDSVQTQRLVRPPPGTLLSAKPAQKAIPGAANSATSPASGGTSTVTTTGTARGPSTGTLLPALAVATSAVDEERNWVISMEIFAPTDGRRPVLLSGSSTGVATAWDLLSGAVVREFAGVHTMDVSGVSFVETDFPRFVTINHATRRNQGPIKPPKPSASDSGVSTDLRACGSTEDKVLLVVTASFDAKIAIWDFDSGEVLQVLTGVHTDTISHVAASAPYGVVDYAFVVAGSYDHTASVWNLHTGVMVHRLTGKHTDAVTHVALHKPQPSADSNDNSSSNLRPLALTSGVDCIVVVWDVLSGTAIRTLTGGHVERIKTVTTYQPRDGSAALVLTGGYDKRAVVWDLNTGAVKRVLTGVHKNWVTSVTVVEPNDGGKPFIVTGGFDGMPVLWDLSTGRLIAKLEGAHNNGIRTLAAYSGVPGDHGRYAPLLFSAGHDSYIVKWDTPYPFVCMPPRAAVQVQFELDRAESPDKGWPRISALSARFGDPLWAENGQMFIRACKLRRSDFMARFEGKLAMLLGRLGDVETGKSLLRYSLEKKDLQSVRVVLRCWAKLLNEPVCDLRRINIHASMRLPLQEVLLVGETYPAEFTAFLTSLRLVKVETDAPMAGVIQSAASALTQGCSLDAVHEPFRLFPQVAPYGQESRGQAVTLTFVPLLGAASVEMLHTLMQTSQDLNSVEVFDSDVAIHGLRFAWKHYGLRVHAIGVASFVIFFAIYTPNIFLFDRLVHGSAGERGFGWFLQSVTLILILLRGCVAGVKLRYARETGTLEQYLTDGWNALEVTAIVLCLIGLLARYAVSGECDTSRCTLAIATIMLWMLGLYFLRPFRVSGPLGKLPAALFLSVARASPSAMCLTHLKSAEAEVQLR
jgi:WD40 repeat protein